MRRRLMPLEQEEAPDLAAQELRDALAALAPDPSMQAASQQQSDRMTNLLLSRMRRRRLRPTVETSETFDLGG